MNIQMEYKGCTDIRGRMEVDHEQEGKDDHISSSSSKRISLRWSGN